MLGQHPGTGFTIWITGMHAAGKRSLAREVASRLKRLDKPVEFIDGAEWEQFIGKGPGETKDERNAIVRRTGFVAKAITRAGGFAIVAQISPYRETREGLRREIGRFLEVFVDCPIESLMARAKSEYERAMRGEIRNFIGITDPYEPPAMPEVKYDSSKLSIDEGASLVMEALVREGALTAADVGLSRTPKKEKKKAKKAPEPILFTPEMLVLPKPQPRPPAPPPSAKAPAKSAAPVAKAAPAAASKAAPAKAPAAAKAAPAAKKPEPKKPEAKKAEPKKAEPKKPEPKKPEAKKTEPKKPEAKKAEKPEAKKSAAVKLPAKASKTAPKKIAARTARVGK